MNYNVLNDGNQFLSARIISSAVTITINRLVVIITTYYHDQSRTVGEVYKSGYNRSIRSGYSHDQSRPIT